MSIQWFPGHMAKARREVEEKLNLVDVVIELVDARAPLSSQNPMLQQITKGKPSLMVLMKADLADDPKTKKWLQYLNEQNINAIAIDANKHTHIQRVIQKVQEIGQDKHDKDRAKGIKSRAVRAIIVGIPNVGKSTLINRLAHKRIAKVGDRPGITRHQLWIKIQKDFELLDTPGILWPKFEEERVGFILAAIGTIKDQLLPLQDIAAHVITYLQKNYSSVIEKRYGIDRDEADMWYIFEEIGKQHGALQSGGTVNFDQVSEIVLQDLRSGRLGKITLE